MYNVSTWSNGIRNYLFYGRLVETIVAPGTGTHFIGKNSMIKMLLTVYHVKASCSVPMGAAFGKAEERLTFGEPLVSLTKEIDSGADQ